MVFIAQSQNYDGRYLIPVGLISPKVHSIYTLVLLTTSYHVQHAHTLYHSIFDKNRNICNYEPIEIHFGPAINKRKKTTLNK